VQEYIRVHNMMIEKFHPLPDGWREMYDAGTGRHYYWSVKYLLYSFVDPDRFGSGSVSIPSTYTYYFFLENFNILKIQKS
jgi:hypothetical protein